MEVYEHCLLWGASLKEWAVLKRVSEFPSDTACLSMGTKPQDRDALVAIAAILRGDSEKECAAHINRLSSGPKKGGKLLAEVLQALVAKDSVQFGQKLVAYLKQYKSAEFPKDKLTNKISVEGTLAASLARELNMEFGIPDSFEPHIVKLRPETASR
jgi:hypothetical protein